MFGLSLLQILCLAGAAFLGLTYLKPGTDFSSIVDAIKGMLGKLFSPSSAPVDVKKPVVVDGSPTTVEIVQRWESLKEVLHAAGLTDAEQELDELWKLLSPKAKKDTI